VDLEAFRRPLFTVTTWAIAWDRTCAQCLLFWMIIHLTQKWIYANVGSWQSESIPKPISLGEIFIKFSTDEQCLAYIERDALA
jgi:hypothetical protein